MLQCRTLKKTAGILAVAMSLSLGAACAASEDPARDRLDEYAAYIREHKISDFGYPANHDVQLEGFYDWLVESGAYKAMSNNGCALLMPQMVVCEGRLPEVECRFETLDNGRRVVMTNLNTRISASEVRPLSIATSADAFHLLGLGKTNPQISQGSVLRFYRFEQQMNDGYPKVVVDCCDLVMEEDSRAMPTLSGWHFLSVGGHLAIADVDDENKGWAVVLYDPKKRYASSQQMLTTCRLYEQFATEEAAKEAANSYGNVVGPMMLVPNE